MRYGFGAYVLDTRRYELQRAGASQALRPKAFAVLAYLLAHRDRVVTKQELLEQVWPGLFVAETTLAACIMAVRKALGDSGSTPQVVQTVRSRGYRFVAPVVEEPPGAGPLAPPRAVGPLAPPLPEPPRPAPASGPSLPPRAPSDTPGPAPAPRVLPRGRRPPNAAPSRCSGAPWSTRRAATVTWTRSRPWCRPSTVPVPRSSMGWRGRWGRI